MPQVKIMAKDVRDVSIADFTEAASGKVQGGEVRLRGGKYRVEVQGGKISVTREGGILRNFRRADLSGMLQRRLQDQLSEKLGTESVVANTRAALARRFDGTRDGEVEVASYGFETVRSMASGGIAAYNKDAAATGATTVRGTKIDGYNASVGITWWEGSTRILPSVLKGIRAGDLKTTHLPHIADADRNAWGAYLTAHADRLDVFARVRGFLKEGLAPRDASAPAPKETGWASEVRKNGPVRAMEAFVRKNLTASVSKGISDADIPEIAAAFTAFCKALEGMPEPPDNDFTESFCRSFFGDGPGSVNKIMAFENVAQTAFFRQTSKLGLEFFRDRGVPVMFQWADPGGRDMESPGAQGHPGDKWWTDPGVSLSGRYAPITFSEMRHVERLARQGGTPPLDIVRVQGSMS